MPDDRPDLGLSVRGLEPGPRPRDFIFRSFTQLTAIGQWMELLANIVAGTADTPYLSREQALAKLTHLVKSLRQDQARPAGSAPGTCWGTSLIWPPASGSARWPSDVEKRQAPGRLRPGEGRSDLEGASGQGVDRLAKQRPRGRHSAVGKYGWDHFDGPLAPFSDNATKQKIMDILDQRVVMVVFIDNANLSAAVAKSIGALLEPRDQGPGRKSPSCGGSWNDSSRIQQEGYARLYDAKAGQFYFGWDATKDRHVRLGGPCRENG